MIRKNPAEVAHSNALAMCLMFIHALIHRLYSWNNEILIISFQGYLFSLHYSYKIYDFTKTFIQNRNKSYEIMFKNGRNHFL